MLGTLSSNRKVFRKQKRLQQKLLTDKGIDITEDPCNNICVCNAGLATGLNEQDFVSTFTQYGDVDRVLMLSGESYCFITFTEIKNAKEAFLQIHGKTNLAQGGGPLYLSYVHTVPLPADEENKVLPDGLNLIENFVSEEEEKLLLSCVDWDEMTPKSTMKHRRVKHYGYEFIYGKNNIDLKNPLFCGIPKCCDFLWKYLENSGIKQDKPPDQLTVNQYNPGQGIPSHIDTHSAFLSPLLSLSLGSGVFMDFRCGSMVHTVFLPPRSLLVMDGSSRYEWTHGISPRTYDLVDGRTKPRGQRTSFTFRWVRLNGSCDCQYTQYCDTFKANQSVPVMEDLAPLIEQQLVHQVYEKIASHFSETRFKIWPSVKNFVEGLPMGAFLVDIGCGNGKNLRLRKDLMQIGVEYNNTLAFLASTCGVDEELDLSKKSLNQITQANCLNLPLKCGCADAVISIAVFHHLATEERRLQAIIEALRVLRVGGEALISVWAKDQARNNDKTSYLKQSRKNRKYDEKELQSDKINESYKTQEIKDFSGTSHNVNLPVHINRTQFMHQDVLVPWKLKNKVETSENVEDSTFMRYYHVFEEGELERLCHSIPKVAVTRSFYEQGNWCIILKKQI